LTLVGVGPASGAVVVGAVARPASVPPPVPTDRNLFDAIDPTADTEDAADDHAWPDATGQGRAPAPAARRSPSEEVPPQARAARSSRLLWAVLALVIALGSVTAVAWRAHAARSRAAPTAVAPPLPHTVLAPAPPAAAPSPAPVVTTALPPFDAEAAESALADTAKTVARCRYGEVYGKGHAGVTFGGDGAVTECALSGRFRWTRTGACVKAALSAVRLAPFSGGPEIMVHPFEVAPR
jgi:hypothetical protein